MIASIRLYHAPADSLMYHSLSCQCETAFHAFRLNSTNQIVHRSRLVLSNPYSPSPSLPGSYNILIMRWSLILSTFLTVLSTFSAALVIPTSESLVDLERRAGSANLKASSSNNYYENHNSAYEFDHTGAETHLIYFFFN